MSLPPIAGAIRRCKATSDSRRESLGESGTISVVFAPVTDLFGVCEHLDDSERPSTKALAEEIDGEGFTSDYASNFQSC